MSKRNLYELYKRGKITEEELKRATGLDKVYKNCSIKKYNNDKFNKKDEEETKDFSIDNALEGVLEKEFEEFKRETLKKSKEEIFESAYEITSKEEIKDNLKHMNLHRAEKEMLILQDDILNEFYHDWLDDDTPLGESMKPCIEESIGVLTKYIWKRFNLKREKDER